MERNLEILQCFAYIWCLTILSHKVDTLKWFPLNDTFTGSAAPVSMGSPCLMTTSTAAPHLSSPMLAQKSPLASSSTMKSRVPSSSSWSIAACVLTGSVLRGKSIQEIVWISMRIFLKIISSLPGFPSCSRRRSWQCPQEPHRWGRTSTQPEQKISC